MTQQQTAKSLEVDPQLEKEFAEALKHQLTDDDIERARLLLGHDTASKQRELYSVATPDALRNWALGVGDDNPLYTDEEYGPATRWGSQIGHGTMVGHVKTPMLGDPLPEEVRRGTKGVFRGVHVFVSGGTWDWYRPLYPGDRIFSFAGPYSSSVYNGLSSPTPSAQLRIASGVATEYSSRCLSATSWPMRSRARSMSSSVSL